MVQLINFYKITSTNTDKCYVGSTRHPISERLIRHELDYVNFNNGYGNRTTSFIIIDFKNYSIHLIESVFCLSKCDRNEIEQKHILNTNNRVNIKLPGRTRARYYQDTKETRQQKHNCNCGGTYTTQNKFKHERTQKHQSYTPQ